MGVDWIGILFVFPLAVILIYLRRKKSFLTFPTLYTVPTDWAGRSVSFLLQTAPYPILLILLFLAAGPRFPKVEGARYEIGSDIVFVLDESGSMEESSGTPAAQNLAVPDPRNKFSMAKSVVAKFTERRKEGRDRYGLIVFGSSGVPVLPLTFNHELFLTCLYAQEPVLQATIFAYPLALALDELLRSKTRSRSIVLVSDGGGTLDDDLYGFSGIIKKHGIRFYWISIAAEDFHELREFMNRISPLGKKLDASSPAELEAGFTEIDKLERSVIPYSASVPVISFRPLLYAAWIFMGLLWACHSLLIYDRRF